MTILQHTLPPKNEEKKIISNNEELIDIFKGNIEQKLSI